MMLNFNETFDVNIYIAMHLNVEGFQRKIIKNLLPFQSAILLKYIIFAVLIFDWWEFILSGAHLKWC